MTQVLITCRNSLENNYPKIADDRKCWLTKDSNQKLKVEFYYDKVLHDSLIHLLYCKQTLQIKAGYYGY